MHRILIIEDNEMNRDMLSRRLIHRGFEVSTAKDGLEGLDRARAESPDLILLDMSLPKKDGWEVARNLKEDIRTRAIPVIALTAHAMAGDRERALKAGCDEYDIKPVEMPRLIEKIAKVLRLELATER
jgi:CheY-like chemotaxis protein